MSTHWIHTAPTDSTQPVLGRTLASLLDQGCDLNCSTPAVTERTPDGEYSLTARELRVQADRLASSLLELGIERGDRVILFLSPGVAFTIIDFACHITGIINIPLYESCRTEDLVFIIDETESTAIFLSGEEECVKPIIDRPSLKHVIATGGHDVVLPDIDSAHARLVHVQDLLEKGQVLLAEEPELPARLRSMIDPHDIATLIYTSGTTGRPKGVQLTHENITFNGMTAFADVRIFRQSEISLSIIPLAHVFQRTLHYTAIAHGWPIYFTKPVDFKEGLLWARPSTFAAVPRVLEKIHEGIITAGSKLTGLKRAIFTWAMALADRQEIGRTPGLLERLYLKVAYALVYSKWQEAVGGRLRVIVCGGAALNPRTANFFSAWGIRVLQGFGLTETSAIVTFNRPRRNRAGTVGHPLPGVEVSLAEDGEILTRGPHVTSGYYKRPDETANSFDKDGWFHTGDIGTFDEDGFLCIIDRKKNLFKLSTGRYIAPQPMEMILTSDPRVDQALIAGTGQKFVVALIIPEERALRAWARTNNIDADVPIDSLLKHPEVIAQFQELVDSTNATVAEYHGVKRFLLLNATLSTDNGLLTPTLKIRRAAVAAKFAAEIDALFQTVELNGDLGDTDN